MYRGDNRRNIKFGSKSNLTVITILISKDIESYRNFLYFSAYKMETSFLEPQLVHVLIIKCSEYNFLYIDCYTISQLSTFQIDGWYYPFRISYQIISYLDYPWRH